MSMTTKQESDFMDALHVLKETGALEHITVVGSWAEYLYEKTEMLKDFEYIGKTTDIDILIQNLRKPMPAVDIVSAMCDRDFIYTEDYMTGCSKFRKDDIEIEFLICQKGDGSQKLPRTNIGINAQQLTHMDMVSKNTVSVQYQGLNINIPCPEVYAIQKMIINDRRKDKAITDQQKVVRLSPYINIDKFNDIYKSLYTKEQTKVREFIDKYIPNIYFNGTSFESPTEKPTSVEMEKMWHDYMNLPKEERHGIEWNGDKMRPAIFDDMYLAQCKKEGKEPDKTIYDHFWKNCVKCNDYEPKYCVTQNKSNHIGNNLIR